MEKKNWAIVDDDVIFHLTTETFIKKKKVDRELYFFRDGKELFEYIVEHKEDAEHLPDVILLDLKMPVMDGWDFIDQYVPLRNDIAKNIAVYIVSSSVDHNDIERAQKIQVVKKYIVKPIGLSHIENIIDDLKAA